MTVGELIAALAHVGRDTVVTVTDSARILPIGDELIERKVFIESDGYDCVVLALTEWPVIN